MGYDNFNSADVYFLSALKDCSPNVVKFLRGLALGEKEAGIDYAFLDKLGCRQYDGKGDYWRLVSVANGSISGGVQSPALRGYNEQCELYMVGRAGTANRFPKTLSCQGVAVPKILQGAWRKLVSSSVKSGSYVVTNAWGGKSYHNYGLAVDICLRHFGDTFTISSPVKVGGVVYDNLRKVYEKCGLLSWAKRCGLEWGGDWSDFPDYVHFQDTAYKPIPYKVYHGAFCLQNEDNCCFEVCRKYWAGYYDKELSAFERAFDSDSPSVSTKEDVPTSSEGWLSKVKGGSLLALLVLGGLVYYLTKKRR